MSLAHATIDVTVSDTGRVRSGTARVDLVDMTPQGSHASAMTVGISVNPKQYGDWWPQFPDARYTRVFVPAGSGAPNWKRQALTGLPPSVTRIHVSWKDIVPMGLIVAFVDQLPDGIELDLTWQHEPEPERSRDAYVAGWRALHDALEGHPKRHRVRLVNVHTLWASRHKTRQVNWRRWMLPEWADIESWDCYRDVSFDAYEPAESLFGLPYLAAQEFDRPWAVAEFGGTLCTWDTVGTARAQWYRDGAGFAALHGCEAMGFWCSTSTSGELDYRPHDQATADAIRSIMRISNR